VRSRVHGRERETDRAGRKNAYLDVALPTGEMEWEVQSELEWFTEDEACSKSVLFRVILGKKKTIRLPCVVRRHCHPSSVRFVGGGGGEADASNV